MIIDSIEYENSLQSYHGYFANVIAQQRLEFVKNKLEIQNFSYHCTLFEDTVEGFVFSVLSFLQMQKQIL